jgi:trk system potassium uptake protein TrkA
MPDYMHAKIVEVDARRCERLNEIIRHHHVLILHGDGRDLDLLVDEGIQHTDGFAALTDNSEANILACLAAKRLGVRKTVAMVENMDYIAMAESLDIGTIINKKAFAASHIYQMMLKADVTTMKSLTVANADVAEFVVREGARITRKPVKDLDLPNSVTLGGLVRDGQGYLINGMTQVLPGDTVVAFCLENSISRLEKFFK